MKRDVPIPLPMFHRRDQTQCHDFGPVIGAVAAEHLVISSISSYDVVSVSSSIVQIPCIHSLHRYQWYPFH